MGQTDCYLPLLLINPMKRLDFLIHFHCCLALLLTAHLTHFELFMSPQQAWLGD